MSQIPRSQFAVKKRSTASPMVTIPVLEIEKQRSKKSHSNGASNNGNGNGHKNGTFDNETIIIDDDCFAVVGHEEVVAVEETVELISPSKKKRSRKSKDSTESKDSDVSKKKSDEAAKSPEKPKKSRDVEKQDFVEGSQKQDLVEEVAPETKEMKIVKLTSEGLSSSKRRSDRLVNASTFVNISTDSSNDQSTKILTDETLEGSPVGVEHRVSGRRSTRPIDDIKYTYRSPNQDDSLNGTTNATLGSEINNDSILATPVTDRKRRQLDDSMENLDSPKRSRLNLSGLFSSFSSPVALLRNRFKRANIASTPLAGSDALFNESNELDTSAGQMKEVELNEKDIVETTETLSGEKEEDLKVITTPIKKTSCIVM